MAVCVLILYIYAFSSYTQYLCINAELFYFFSLQITSQAVSLKVDQAASILKFKVAFIRLQGNIISSNFKKCLK